MLLCVVGNLWIPWAQKQKIWHWNHTRWCCSPLICGGMKYILILIVLTHRSYLNQLNILEDLGHIVWYLSQETHFLLSKHLVTAPRIRYLLFSRNHSRSWLLGGDLSFKLMCSRIAPVDPATIHEWREIKDSGEDVNLATCIEGVECEREREREVLGLMGNPSAAKTMAA